MDVSFSYGCLLLVTGFLAGIINTLAGGGSNLTLPSLMVMGMPAEVANATNRVAVLMQSVTALFGFKNMANLIAKIPGLFCCPPLSAALLVP